LQLWVHRTKKKKTNNYQKQNTENKNDEQYCRDKKMKVNPGARDGLAEFAFHTTLAIGDMMYHQLAPYSQFYGDGLVKNIQPSMISIP
jgi:hypothetical protein